MILSVSRRTDIPCNYSEWFINRLKAGYVMVRNPMNDHQVSKILLSPEVIDCIVFWTKDPNNIMDKLPYLDELGYRYYFQFTLTAYEGDMEKGLREKTKIEESFLLLSEKIGRGRVKWRYDPIILNDKYTECYHMKEFHRMCKKLSPYTESVTISFVDLYTKIKKIDIQSVPEITQRRMADKMVKIAREYGLEVKACCESHLINTGITPASCVDKETIECLCNASLIGKKDKNQRDSCGCFESIDIGAYNTCCNGCIYCYANYGEDSIRNNCQKHDPKGELLIGRVKSTDIITVKRMVSSLDYQLHFL